MLHQSASVKTTQQGMGTICAIHGTGRRETPVLELMEGKTEGLKELVRLSQRIHKEDLPWNKTPKGGNPYGWHGSLYLLKKHPELELPGRGLQVWTRKVLAERGNRGSQPGDTNPQALSADITQLSSLC